MSGFRFHDSLTRQLKAFDVPKDREVRIYTCGPTVYSKVHLGNYRAYTCWDVLRRSLELGGHKVRQVVNITDVGHLTDDDFADAEGEDKLEAQSRREGRTAKEVAAYYTQYFFDVAKKLNWRLAADPDTDHPRATAYVRNDAEPHDVRTMIGHVEELIRRGNAYATPTGNVYFDVASFPAYGRLSGNTIEQLVAGARVEVLTEKRHPADFALWKRDEKHQMQWDSPWGRGFPGWHIECSVMSRALLGDTLDIHTGGEDHLFPHHECEIAQSEAVTGKPMSNLWMHNRFLLVDGAKMSKSKGTMYVLEDVEQHFEAKTDEEKRRVHRALRYFLLSTHYRAPMNFTWEALDGASEGVGRLDEMVRDLVESPSTPDREEIQAASDDAGTRFLRALQYDLNVSDALSVVHEFRVFVNSRGPFSPSDLQHVVNRIKSFDSLLGLNFGQVHRVEAGSTIQFGQRVDVVISNPRIDGLVADREAARKARDFARADAIRRELEAEGVVIKDTPTGVRWFRK